MYVHGCDERYQCLMKTYDSTDNKHDIQAALCSLVLLRNHHTAPHLPQTHLPTHLQTHLPTRLTYRHTCRRLSRAPPLRRIAKLFSPVYRNGLLHAGILGRRYLYTIHIPGRKRVFCHVIAHWSAECWNVTVLFLVLVPRGHRHSASPSPYSAFRPRGSQLQQCTRPLLDELLPQDRAPVVPIHTRHIFLCRAGEVVWTHPNI
jgi:hypothetical protein